MNTTHADPACPAAQAAHSFPLDGREVLIGRDASCDICLAGVGVSRRHAVIRCGEVPTISDAGSAHGTRLDGGVLSGEAVLPSGSALTVGTHVFQVYIDDGYISLTHLNSGGGAADGIASGDGKILRIGRDPANDICLPHPMVSRFHAIVKGAPGRLTIVDRGSANYTYVNGNAVGASALAEGDVVHIGPFRFFVKDGKFCGSEAGGGINKIRIEAQGLGVRIGEKTLLEDVNLTIEPGDFVALLGGSGAGKSTLSKVLSGQLAPTSGRLFMNGFPAAKFGAAFARGIGYVSQQILLRPELTVWETLADQSLIRLPGDSVARERLRRAGEVLELMGLSKQRDLRVSNLSGGEARRLHVGVELLASPAVVILDEPLAGLDPGLVIKFMRLFRRICDKGHTLILITHTLERIELCDRAVYIESGRALFSGSPKDICGHFKVPSIARIYERGAGGGTERVDNGIDPPIKCCPTSPPEPHAGARGDNDDNGADSGVNENIGADTERDFGAISGTAVTVIQRKIGAAHPARHRYSHTRSLPRVNRVAAVRRPVRSILFLARQSAALVSRYFKVYARDRRNMIVLMAQTPLITLLLTLVYKSSTLQFPVSFYFCLTVTGIWVGGLSAVREVAAEMPMLAREARCGMSGLSYAASRVVVAAGLSAAQALLFAAVAAIVFVNLDFTPALLVTLFAAIFSGNVLGLVVSVCSGGVSRAVSTLPIVLIPQIFFSGILVPFEHITELGRRISYLTISRPVFGVMKKAFLLDRPLFWHSDWTELFLLCASLIIIFWVALKCRVGRFGA